jgi:hypothetical protein
MPALMINMHAISHLGLCYKHTTLINNTRNTKGGSITALLTSCLTGLESAV